jgi:hypothetical protein
VVPQHGAQDKSNAEQINVRLAKGKPASHLVHLQKAGGFFAAASLHAAGGCRVVRSLQV